MRAVTVAGACVAGFGAVTAALNLVTMPRLVRGHHADVTERITVCVPARNEATRLPELLADLAAQRFCPTLHVIVVDDDSTDGTADAARATVGNDPRFEIVSTHVDPPPGWTGKAAACAELAQLAPNGGILVFVDADVRLTPDALAGAASALRERGASLLCPWPAQLADVWAPRLVQPLLAWSWMSTLPVVLGNVTTSPSMAVACGQLMMFDASAYRAAGGHGAVASSLAEDLDIARVLRRRGERTVVAASAGAVRCRMYDATGELRDGYSRWLWREFGGRVGSVAVVAVVAAAYVVPPLAMLGASGSTRRWGAVGYAAAVASRAASRRMELPESDALSILVSAGAHPFSITAFAALVIESHRRARRGRLGWKARSFGASSDLNASRGEA